MRTGLCGLGTVLAILLAVYPAFAGDTKDDVAKLSKEYDAAIKARDKKALDKLFDDGGRFIPSDGRLLDKREYVAALVDEMSYESSTSDNATLQVFGDTVIETGRWIGTGKKDGKPVRHEVRYTCVWAKKAGTWVIVAEQSTPISGGH